MPNTLKYSLFVFLGGCCYGAVIPLVKSAYALGFTVPEVLVSQYLFGLLIMGLTILLVSRRKLSLRQLGKLMLVGLLTSGTSFFYYSALDRLPGSIGVTLLFQFAWMGVLLQILVEKKMPSRTTLIAVAAILIGTLLAAGVFEDSHGYLDPLGIVCGLLSAACYTLFLFTSGRVETGLPSLNRSFCITLGGFFVALAMVPDYFSSGVLPDGIWQVGIPLGIFGIALPIVLISYGTPHLPSGLSTIMASGELPLGILAAAVFLGEKVTVPIVIGVIIILGGICLSQVDGVRRALARHEVAKQKSLDI